MRRIAALFMVCAAVACAGMPGASPASGPAQALRDSLRIDGSTGVMPLVQALAAEYAGGPVAFGVGLGSSARLEAVRQGRIDIALASHGIVVADIERQGLEVRKIADVPVGFGVHSSVSVDDLSEAQVCDIYAGRTTNWKQVGGADLAIVVATRPKGEVDGDVVTAALPCVATPHSSVVSKEKPEDMAAFLASTPGAIGMTTTTVTGQSGGKIRLVSIGGVAATPESVLSGRYRMTRESFLVTRAGASPSVADFIAFIRSARGARIIAQTGAIPR